MILHLIQDYQRFGCSYIYDVECFESLNKISRNAITSSNNTDDSRAADKFWTRDDASRHMLSNGMWCSASGRTISSPGTKLVQIIGPLFADNISTPELTPISGTVYRDLNSQYLVCLDKYVFKVMQLSNTAPLYFSRLSKMLPASTREQTVDEFQSLEVVPTITMNNQLYLNKYQWR
jgi:hypothetical protein